MAIDLEALKAEFAARGGKATQVAEGERAIESDRTIYRAMREGTRAKADSIVQSERSEALWERQQEAFRAAKYSGWSTEDALDYAEHAK